MRILSKDLSVKSIKRAFLSYLYCFKKVDEWKQAI